MNENEFTAYLKESLHKKDLNKIIFSRTAALDEIEELLRKAYIFYKELMEWNKKINLTAITKPMEFIERNVVDSLMVFKILDCGFSENSENLRNNTLYQHNEYNNGYDDNDVGIININNYDGENENGYDDNDVGIININNYDGENERCGKDNIKTVEKKINICSENCKKENRKNSLKLLDIGSGAGLPGIILKIFNSDASLYSIESVLKKCAFQKFVARKLDLEDFYCINENAYKIYELPKVNTIITRAAFNANELIHLIDSLKIKNFELPINLILFLTNLKDANAIANGKYSDKNLYIDKILMYKNNSEKDKKFKQIVNFKITSKI